MKISRRQFCGSLAGCAGVAAIAACGAGGGSGTTVDAMLPPSDGVTNGTCPTTGATDVGAASTFMTGKPVYFSQGNFFVVRDAGGLYALTARCPHQGFTTMVEGTNFVCPRHGSEFSFDGAVLTGPATAPLVHYAMCTLSNGNVGVLTSQTVAETVRLAV